MINTANLLGTISRNAGGLNESVRRLLQCMLEIDVGINVLSVKDEYSDIDLPAWNPLNSIVFPARWPRSFAYSPGFIKTLTEIRPDVVHTHGIWQYPSIATARYCYRFRVPYMISPHGMLDPWALRHHRWKKIPAYAFYEGAHLRNAACIRALCDSEALSIRKLGLKNPIAIIPNGIDLPDENTCRRAEAKNPFAQINSVSNRRKVLLYLSRIHPKKGLVNLIHAWKQLQSEPSSRTENEWILAIAGWDQGGHETELKTLATELQIPWWDARESSKKESASTGPELRNQRSQKPTSLVFLGPQFGDDKSACYANCDAFVLPSFSEGLPMVVLEAWAYSKPVLMTPECNLPEGYAADAAIRIETGTDSILNGLRAMTNMSCDSLRSVGKNGQDLVLRQFTWQSVANQLKTTYEWMLDAAPRPDWVFLS